MDGQDNRRSKTTTYPRLGGGPTTYRGMPREGLRDAYHRLLTMPLVAFLAVMAIAFITLNTLFGLAYMIDPGGVAGARPWNFADSFFFSVQTMGTLGYGVMSPHSLYCNLIATLETFVGLFNLAIATGLMFARISRPTAKIMFSERAVISKIDGVETLTFRAANRRRNMVIEADVSVTMLFEATTAEGGTMRRFVELPVTRSRSPLFFLTWQVMHPIDAASPLHGETRRSLLSKKAEIIVVMKGLDETFVSTIHARTSYTPHEIVWGARLADIFTTTSDGGREIDFSRFHDVSET